VHYVLPQPPELVTTKWYAHTSLSHRISSSLGTSVRVRGTRSAQVIAHADREAELKVNAGCEEAFQFARNGEGIFSGPINCYEARKFCPWGDECAKGLTADELWGGMLHSSKPLLVGC